MTLRMSRRTTRDHHVPVARRRGVGVANALLVALTATATLFAATLPSLSVASGDGVARASSATAPAGDDAAPHHHHRNLRGQDVAPASTGLAYSADTALDVLMYAGAAYCPQAQLESWTCFPCRNASTTKFELVSYLYNASTDVAAYVGLDVPTDTLVVAFRGTEPTSTKDWWDNLDFVKEAAPVLCEGCHVHSGFYDAYNSLAPGILRAVFSRNPTSVLVTGHSLGAALAQLAAFDLADRGVPLKSVHTFGAPRVGDSAFAAAYDAKVLTSFRLTHHRDLVVHVPPEAFGFRHVSREVFYDAEAGSIYDYVLCDGSGEDPKCSDQFYVDTSVWDHRHYLDYAVSTC